MLKYHQPKSVFTAELCMWTDEMSGVMQEIHTDKVRQTISWSEDQFHNLG